MGRLLRLALGRLLLLGIRDPGLTGCRSGVDRLVVGRARLALLGLRRRRPLGPHLVRPILLLALEVLLALRLVFAGLLIAGLLSLP